MKKLCGRLLKLINKHIKVLNNDLSDDNDDDYIWSLFKNFSAKKQNIWINRNEIRFLINSVVNKSKSNIELAEKFIVFDDDTDNDKFKKGEYLHILQEKMTWIKVNYAVEYVWTVNAMDIKKLKNGESGGIVCNDYWDYYFNGDQNKMGIFGGNMIAGYDENDNCKHQERQETMIGFYWRITDIPDGYKSVMIDAETYCPQIELYIQFFDIKMSLSGGNKNVYFLYHD